MWNRLKPVIRALIPSWRQIGLVLAIEAVLVALFLLVAFLNRHRTVDRDRAREARRLGEECNRLLHRFDRMPGVNEQRNAPEYRKLWREYLSSLARDGEYPEVTRFEEASIANCRGYRIEMGYVHVPAPFSWVVFSPGEDDYLAFGYTSWIAPHRQQHYPCLIAFSPSRSDRVFLAPLSSPAEARGLCERTVKAHDWGKPFCPNVTEWSKEVLLHDSKVRTIERIAGSEDELMPGPHD
jgi:hypothetical protein